MHTLIKARRALRWSGWWNLIFVVLLMVTSFLAASIPAAHAAGEIGYPDFSYSANGDSGPTGEKPESKLWWNDGFWWGSLYNNVARAYHIYRLDIPTQKWVDTGTQLDPRSFSRADTLWDGQHLYVVSHIFANTGTATSTPSSWGRLYRYSYNAATDTYSLDMGFPVTVTRGKSETLVVDKDSTGQLWVTYVEGGKVMVNHSVGDDSAWGTPYVLPVAGASGIDSDDISSLIAYNGMIGVMWSNQKTRTMYFAVHADGLSDGIWASIRAYAPGGDAADDHINLKSLQTDGRGKVFAVVKTSFNRAASPSIVLLACTDGSGCASAGSWQAATVYMGLQDQTRPLLLIDTDNRDLHVFSADEGGGAVYHKSSDLDTIAFSPGPGMPFIQSSTYTKINDPTSTKQNVNNTTGIVVLASDDAKNFYVHNYLGLGHANPTPSAEPSASPSPSPSSLPSPSPVPSPTPRTQTYRVFLPTIGQ